MSNTLSLLDQALILGEQELSALALGDVDTAHESASERGKLIERAWNNREGVALDSLREKLLQLQSMQGKLTDEAKRLHSSIKAELQKTKKHANRLSGYKQAVRVTPLHSHFVSKQG